MVYIFIAEIHKNVIFNAIFFSFFKNWWVVVVSATSPVPVGTTALHD